MNESAAVLTIERPETGIVRIGLNRPDKRNALDPELRLALIEAMAEATTDDGVHAGILAGNGGNFCSVS